MSKQLSKGILPISGTGALIVLSHNDRGVQALMIGGPLCSKHMMSVYILTPLRFQENTDRTDSWTIFN